MQIDEEALNYLKGNRFSNGWRFSVPSQKRVVTRNNRLLEIAKGKTVIHLGCVDHVELIEEKIRRGLYLHKLLEDVTRKLIGIDINEEGINEMMSLGFENIYLPSEVPMGHYDLLIASDVIEHVPNVDLFLREIQRYDFDQLVVTTPNAYRRTNRRQYRGELINTDHHCWFSPYTLAKVLINTGYQVETIEFTDKLSRVNFYRNMMLKKYPLQQDGLLVVAKKPNN
jgi:hypothetical protein